MTYIKIKGARCHNLKNVSVSIPRYQFTVVTGISGSGKSSLVFDTLYVESQRRYLESLASYGRDFRGIFDKPDVDDIEGLSPTIAIHQKFRSSNPRSTVGTLTDIYDYLRLLYSKFGYLECPSCSSRLTKKDPLSNSNPKPLRCNCGFKIKDFPKIDLRVFSFNTPQGACPNCQGLGTKLEIDPDLVIPNTKLSILEGAIRPLTSLGGARNNFWRSLQAVARKEGVDLSKPIMDLSKRDLKKILYGTDGWEGVVSYLEKKYQKTGSNYLRSKIEHYMRFDTCPECSGSRLNSNARRVLVAGTSIDTLTAASLDDVVLFFKTSFPRPNVIAKKIIKEILVRLKLLQDSSLSYLSLNRSTVSLSGGEIQRIRLATQISLGLSGVVYILDEPSIGLHPKDVKQLIQVFRKLQGQENTVIVVEHDKDIIEAADHIIDVGPGAGDYGGKIVAQGTLGKFRRSIRNSVTSEFLSGKRSVHIRRECRKGSGKKLLIRRAQEHNLKDITVAIPLGKFICVTGVSGSGKSTLVKDILARSLKQKFYRAKRAPGHHQDIVGVEHLHKVIVVDQSPIGRSPRSNPATYTGLFDPIRDFFAELPEAVSLRYGKGQFSFNVKEGRCAICAGEGEVKVELFFLPDVYIKCSKCDGKRYNPKTLAITWRGRNIADILNMSVKQALAFLGNRIPRARKYLKTLDQVGLGYLKLGQPAVTLSGGEAQRVKLASELSRPSTGSTLYILDEPTVGLHFADVEQLLKVLHLLVDNGNTVLVVEHNLDVIKSSDWVIDLGPEGGEKGGTVVATGTPRQVAKVSSSYTGKFLRKVI